MEPVAAGAESALRQARRHRNWTLGQVVRAIDERVPNSGVTESLVSAWERGRRRTSLRYRAALCEIYGQPPEVLFAFQDAGRSLASSAALPARAGNTRRGVGLLRQSPRCLYTRQRRTAHPTGWAADHRWSCPEGEGALRAIAASARPRSWRTFGPRRLRRHLKPALVATQGGT
jgi:transcriptional regulator with XRE-family HTH domain